MMNRRLRERLTEADILQIFVDVCEGVAAMHNLRPALLHRDLKVENILQSSDVLYKLCDFGSASPVAPRLPANTQEIRILEADLNRHTTLQYRAPEMVDPYLRRPIDEKSDVWALGVLLYKLCYYTTPFEEHGPLAILNVQYKIPPYPAYSSQMNSLIGMFRVLCPILIVADLNCAASMLREHGAQRPTAFEILNMVHRMRGTKSKFNYNVPSRSQLVPQLAIDRASTTSAALDGLVSYRSSTASAPKAQVPPSVNPDKNAGVQAREKVLEAIAPLRRGRPTPISLHHATTGPSSPSKEVEHKPSELEFKDAEDESWKAARGAVRGHRSGLASPTRWPPPAASLDDAWSVARGSGTGADKTKDRDRRRTVQGSSLGGFGDSFEARLDLPSISTVATSTSSSPWLSSPQPSAKPLAPAQRPSETSSRIRVPNKAKDAFDGLGLPSDRSPVPTLGDVQKARTGASAGGSGPESSSTNLTVPGRGTTYTSAGSSPRPSPSPRLSSKGPSPAPSASTSWRPSLSPLPHAQSNAPKVDLTVEQRFPAFEDLDRALLPSTAGPPLPTSTLLPSREKKSSFSTPSVLSPKPSSGAFTGPRSPRTGRKLPQTPGRGGGIHSEQATGSAPFEPRDARTPKRERTGSRLPELSPSRLPRLPSRAMPPKRQASLTLTPPVTKGFKSNEPPSPAQIMGRPEPQDWLTGPEDDPMSGTTTKPVLKESPGKRSSVVVKRAPQIPSPQEAVAVSDKRPSPPPSPTPASKTTPSWIMATKQTNADTGSGRPPLQPKPKPGMGSTAPRVSAPPPADSWLPTHKRRDTTSTISSEDGPEDATGYGPPRHAATRESQRVEVKKTDGASAGGRRRSKSKGRQGSVHELVDLWGGKEGRPKSSGAGSGPSFGSKPISQEPEDLGSPSKLLFPPAGQSPKPRSASPSPLISPSISTDSTSAKYDLSSTARSSSRHRKQSANGRDTGPPPSTSAGTATARPRPQSMFLNSPTTAAVKFPLPSPVDGGSTNLDVPSPDTRSQRMRRTSISDMVQRYEAMGGGGSAAPSPASRQPNSSSQLGVSSIARSATTHVSPPSESAAPSPASRQPNTSTQVGVSSLSRSATTHVSPPSRRNQLGAVGLPGLAMEPSKKPLAGIGVSDKPLVEHASPIGLPGLTIERKSSVSYSGRRSPTKSNATGGVGGGTGGGEGGLDAPVRPIPKRSFSPAPPATSDEVQSPAPEKPYQGVGRLIDEWQRKTADTGEAPRSPASRRKGGGGAGTGATASPRRAGVIAGRGAQD
jgi:AP2-associated kinase